MTLLDKAKLAPVGALPRVPRDDLRERADVALSWVRREITIPQVKVAMGWGRGASIQGNIGSVIVTAIRAGIIKAELVQETDNE